MPDEQIKKAVEAAPGALEDSAVIEAMLVELAALSSVEYDQRREEAKNRLGVRYSVLDAEVAKRRPVAKSNTDSTDLFSDPEPWPDPVDGAALSVPGVCSLVLPKEISAVVLGPDGDDPGDGAAVEAAKRFVREGRKVRIARPPHGMDWNDVLREPEKEMADA